MCMYLSFYHLLYLKYQGNVTLVLSSILTVRKNLKCCYSLFLYSRTRQTPNRSYKSVSLSWSLTSLSLAGRTTGQNIV